MPKVFESIHKESTRDKAYQAVRNAILSGRLKTGYRIAEVPLAAELGVSRAIVREALQQLAHEGLVNQDSYRGTRVVRLSPQQIDDTLQVRLLLETEAVRLAHPLLSDPDRKALRSLARRLEAVVNDPKKFVEADLALHHRIWDLSGNEIIARVLTQITVPVFAMSVIMRTQAENVEPGGNWNRGDHTRLVRAICEGSEREAVEAIRFHLTENWKATRNRLGKFLAMEELGVSGDAA
jgi:DNA-binding GntR family transcriptional regulator